LVVPIEKVRSCSNVNTVLKYTYYRDKENIMKAVMLKMAGGPENFEVLEVAKPIIKSNEVLVETRGISLNPADVKAKESDQMLSIMFGEERPVLLGWDISGVVVDVGNEVTKFKKGDKVFGMINFPGQGKTYAEYVAAPEEHLATIPENTSFEEAAATTLAALTAYQMLVGNIKEGDRVLVQGGAGGVGHFGIQIAKDMGAYVITTATKENEQFVRSIGADEVIDYMSTDFSKELNDIDYVLDLFGGEILMKSIRLAGKGSTVYSTLLGAPGLPSDDAEALAKELGVSLNGILVNSNGEHMEVLAKMLAEKRLVANVYATYPLEEMAAAHARANQGNAIGKLVVTN
jgi:NADPH:quinone reductase-like Zn-dependent oxidoreductase